MSKFFAYLSRGKYIERWSLMRNTRKENILEHTAETAQFAYFLAIIKNKFFNGNVNAERVATIALFHEMPEVVTGDLPTPVKYFNSNIKSVYKNIEKEATDKLISLLPQELQDDMKKVTNIPQDSMEYKLVKIADKLSAYIKCLEEKQAGNKDFITAENSIKKELDAHKKEHPELKYFLDNFIGAYAKTLDQLLK